MSTNTHKKEKKISSLSVSDHRGKTIERSSEINKALDFVGPRIIEKRDKLMSGYIKSGKIRR